MSPDRVREVAVCPARDYRTIPEPPPADINLSCRRFPFNGLEVRAVFGFEHGGLKSISLQAPASSEKEARRATELLLSYLAHEGGELHSIDLGSRPVTASAIWDDLDHRRSQRPLQFARVTVTTTNTSWPVVLTASFSKDDNIVSLLILHAS
jgi:hypothetical protein